MLYWRRDSTSVLKMLDRQTIHPASLVLSVDAIHRNGTWYRPPITLVELASVTVGEANGAVWHDGDLAPIGCYGRVDYAGIAGEGGLEYPDESQHQAS